MISHHISKGVLGKIPYIILYVLASFPCLVFCVRKQLAWGMTADATWGYLFLLALSLFFLYLVLRKTDCNFSRTLFTSVILGVFCTVMTTPWLIRIGITDLMLCSLYSCGIIALTHAIFRKWSPLIWFIWIFPPILINAVSLRYQIKVDAHLMSEIIGASPQDVMEFITYPNILLFLLLVMFIFAVSFCMRYYMRRYADKGALISGTTILALTCTLSMVAHKPLWAKNVTLTPRLPESCLMELWQASELAQIRNSHIVQLAETLPSSATPAPTVEQANECHETICIIHVGESVRSDHLSVFGYEKKTTPFLENNPRLIAYKDCISVAPSTVPTTFTILTNACTDIRNEGIDDSLNASCSGIMDIFHALHYSCYACVNSESVNDTFGSLYEKLLHTTFAASADKIVTAPDPQDSHSQIGQIDGLVNSAQGHNVFLLVTNHGSHLPFNQYNKDNPPFSPTSPEAYNNGPQKSAVVAEMTTNAYDNTIHYLDDYINKLLNRLHGKPYIYIYISDHGEYLGDKNIWVRNGDLRSFFTTPVCQVPFLIITSEEFEQQNQHIHEALCKLREHSSMSIGQEHIFHTVLGLFGISSPYYDEELDLTSPKVKPYTGPHPTREGKVSDGKKWH